MADRESLMEASIYGTADGQAVNNVLHLMGDAATGPAPPFPYDLQAIALKIGTDWFDFVLPHLSASYINYRIVVKTIVNLRVVIIQNRRIVERVYGELWDQVFSPGQLGTRPGDVSPTFVAFSVRKRTALAGRSFRGSMRLGPITEADTTVNAVEAARFAALNVSLANLATVRIPAGNSPYRYVVFSAERASRRSSLTAPYRDVSPQLNVCQANGFLGSQVSRKRKQIELG